MSRRVNSKVFNDLLKEGKEALEEVKHAEALYKDEKKQYQFCHFDLYATLKETQLLAVISFVERNYKISEDERKSFMKYYWDIRDLVSKEREKAMKEGWVYTESSWKKIEKTA